MVIEQDQKSIADRLISALQENEFVLYAQRILPAAAQPDEWPFQEIFVRFKEEDAKLLPPGTFFPLLEECQLLPYLDRWVVNRLARWVRSGLAIKPDWKVPRSNVNLASATLLDPEFGRYTRKYVDDSYLSNGLLAFEIAWHDVVAHAEPLQRLIEELRPYGCGFTLAGFDGGKASYAVLETLVPDFIKLSVSITGDIDTVPSHAQKLAEISTRCALLKIKTIVEQVENPVILQRLRQTKIDFVQGYGVAEVKIL